MGTPYHRSGYPLLQPRHHPMRGIDGTPSRARKACIRSGSIMRNRGGLYTSRPEKIHFANGGPIKGRTGNREIIELLLSRVECHETSHLFGFAHPPLLPRQGMDIPIDVEANRTCSRGARIGGRNGEGSLL